MDALAEWLLPTPEDRGPIQIFEFIMEHIFTIDQSDQMLLFSALNILPFAAIIICPIAKNWARQDRNQMLNKPLKISINT